MSEDRENKKNTHRESNENETVRTDCLEMTDDEVEEWILTTKKVLIVLADENEKARDRVYKDFIYDLQLLNEAGRITDIDYDDVMEKL